MENKLNHYKDSIQTELMKTLSTLNYNYFGDALSLITNAQLHGSRLHITGIGKPSYIAKYAASLFSSIGHPTYFLDGTEAVHGSSGQVIRGDVVIAISNSGNTSELIATIKTLKKNGAKIIAICSNGFSALANHADVFLKVKVEQEGGCLNKAPRSSYLTATIVLQALSILLQEKNKLTLEQYLSYHPGGSIGRSKL